MQTYSHLLLTAWLGDRWRRRLPRLRFRALLLGSFAPDVPLILLTLGYFAYRAWLNPLTPGEGVFGPRYDALYFGHPLWIVGHGLLHAPLLIMAMLAAGAWATRRGRPWGAVLLWFAVGCALHSLADILTHHDDGPLLLFPLEWSVRFQSPISYWDPPYHAGIVSPIEHLLDLLAGGYFIRAWLRRRAAVSRVAP